jgi:UDP-N-acetylmuramyl tripeptide synthase
MKKFLAIIIAKEAAFWSRALGKGGGGALPGLIAERIYPDITFDLSKKLRYGNIAITGTNGKTTTSKMVAEILKNAELKVINNQGGSNLSRGLASALIQKTSLLTGRVKEDIGVYEIDEATMPQVSGKLSPKIIDSHKYLQRSLDLMESRQTAS